MSISFNWRTFPNFRFSKSLPFLTSKIGSQIRQMSRQIALSNASNGIRSREYAYFCTYDELS